MFSVLASVCEFKEVPTNPAPTSFNYEMCVYILDLILFSAKVSIGCIHSQLMYHPPNALIKLKKKAPLACPKGLKWRAPSCLRHTVYCSR